MLSTEHAQTGELGRRSMPNSNRLMPPPRFSHVRAVDPAASAPILATRAPPSAANGIYGRNNLHRQRMEFSGGTTSALSSAIRG